MAGSKKRSADEAAEDAGATTRSAKVSRTAAKVAKGKKAPKATLPASEFKARALPLHVNLTHTPPSIPDKETINATSVDPGFVGSTALVPSVFSTGSYGWKGTKRITVELESRETGEKEKVHVMLTINAAVMGSKNAQGEHRDEAAEEDEEVETEGDAKHHISAEA